MAVLAVFFQWMGFSVFFIQDLRRDNHLKKHFHPIKLILETLNITKAPALTHKPALALTHKPALAMARGPAYHWSKGQPSTGTNKCNSQTIAKLI